MTKWKDEIDQALGQDSKFSEALQNKILKQATKRSVNWRYPLTAVAFVMVALLLFLTGPTQFEQEITAVTPFEQLIEQAQVERFFISSSHTESEQFFARDSSRYMHVHAFHETQDTRAMNDFLHAMKLVEASESLWGAKDVLVVMTNGEQLKLKVVQGANRYIVMDIYSKLKYEVTYSDLRVYDDWLEKIDRSTLSIWGILLLFGVIIVLAIVSDRLKKGPKLIQNRKKDWKAISISIVSVILLNVYTTYVRTKEYVMHIDVHFIAVAILVIGAQFVTLKEDMPFKKQLFDWLLIALNLVFLWILINFG